jgi:PAS domain S-box-containing protein
MLRDQNNNSLELLLTISRELATTLDLSEALTKVIMLSMKNVGAERGSLIAVNASFEPIAAAIIVEDRVVSHTADQLRTILDKGLAGRVIKTREPVWIKDTSKDDRWLRRPDDAQDKAGAKSAMCMALMAREQLVGVLTIVHPRPNHFQPDQFSLLQTIADLAGMAIYNAALYASLQASNQRYQELFEDSIDPILITDWNGQIIEANRQAEHLFGKKDGNPSFSIQDLHEIDWHAVGEDFIHLRAGKTSYYETEMQTLDHKIMPAEIYVHKVLINDLEVLQWIIRDISERKALDSLREDLMAMIYHDLRSPLANIVSSLDILDALLPENDTSVKPVFQIAVRSSERMQRLINSLLDIKRLEAGQPITNFKSIDIGTIIHESIETVLPLSDSKHQTILPQIADSIPEIKADEGMLRRILINILENAIKFTPVEGEIQIGSKQQQEMLLIWVKDSGPGIPDEAQEKIFNKFTRLKAKQFPKGIGLGLAFCKLAVNAHGGKIWVESEAGKGSRFNILLPFDHEAANS